MSRPGLNTMQYWRGWELIPMDLFHMQNIYASNVLLYVSRYYICAMIRQGKIQVFLLASLMVYISVSFPLPAPASALDDLIGKAMVTAFEPAPTGPVYLYQERNTCTLFSAWKTNLKITHSGWLNTNLDFSGVRLCEIGNSFVVDLHSYFPCKSRFFFPFHEFL